jgi:hypothetical protein
MASTAALLLHLSALGAWASDGSDLRDEILQAYQDAGLRLYWGDLHGHTGFSDGYGTPDDYFEFARYTAKLDFVAISDHDVSMDRWQSLLAPDPKGRTLWRLYIESTERNYEPGRFVTLLGFEWTGNRYGHRNVYFRNTQDVPPGPLNYRVYRTPADLWEALAPYEAFAVPHHTIRPGTLLDLSYRNDEVERLVEIHSKWGSSEEVHTDYEPLRDFRVHPRLRRQAAGHSVMDMLERGFRVGIVGGTDTHQGMPGSLHRDVRRGILVDRGAPPPATVDEFLALLENGYRWDHREPQVGGGGALTAVFSAELTRDAVWDALYARRAYSTSGPRVELLFLLRTTDEPARTALMGEEIRVSAQPELFVDVTAEPGSLVRRVDLIKNGWILHSEKPDAPSATIAVRDDTYDGLVAYYLVKVYIAEDESGNRDQDLHYKKYEWQPLGPQLEERAWSSPIWALPADHP